MSKARVVKSLTIGSKTYQQVIDAPGDVGTIAKPTGGVPRAKVGELTTRTDDDTGVVTAEAGHGIITSDEVDVYWETGGGGARYGMTATVAGNAITVDGGTGDNLPTLNDDVTIIKPHVEAVSAVLLAMQGLSVYTSRRGRIAFLDDLDVEVGAFELAAGETNVWGANSGEANPLSDDVASVSFSHSDGVAAATMEAALLTT